MLVLGVGNALRGDDAAGLELARRVGAQPGIAARAYEGEAVGLLDEWGGADAVVIIDTVRSGAPVGTIHRIDASSEPVPSPLQRASSHTIGLAEAIELGRTLGRLPARVVIYGIEGSVFEAGSEMSEAVSGTLDRLAEAVIGEADELRTAAS